MLKKLEQRAASKCELCGSEKELRAVALIESSELLAENILLCDICSSQINSPESMDHHHWRCLNDSMWSEHNSVQIMSYRALSLLGNESWAMDLKSQMYLDEKSLEIAELGLPELEGEQTHLDSNGAKLIAGDNVTLIKDLVVNGANFTAKRGTMVRNITLTDNSEHIEGRVNGTRIVLVTKFLKKVNE